MRAKGRKSGRADLTNNDSESAHPTKGESELEEGYSSATWFTEAVAHDLFRFGAEKESVPSVQHGIIIIKKGL